MKEDLLKLLKEHLTFDIIKSGPCFGPNLAEHFKFAILFDGEEITSKSLTKTFETITRLEIKNEI